MEVERQAVPTVPNYMWQFEFRLTERSHCPSFLVQPKQGTQCHCLNLISVMARLRATERKGRNNSHIHAASPLHISAAS